jgi:hypothetical protein
MILREKVSPERAALISEVRELRDSGLYWREVAERMGISLSYAEQLYSDPDGTRTRARKMRHTVACLDCGQPCNFDGSRARRSLRCLSCSTEHTKANAKWTRDAIIAVIQRWADLYGSQPAATDFNPSAPSHRGERARRFREGDYPVLAMVQHVFGSWNAAIEAAGFTPRTGYGIGISDARLDRIRQMLAEGHSYHSIARAQGVTPGAISQVCARHGIRKPQPTKEAVMAAPLKAQQILDREIERAGQHIEKLRADLAEAEVTVAQLRNARTALDATPEIKAVA